MTELDLTGARWHKAQRSGANGDCVEVADNLPEIVAVRDTKDRGGGTLIFPRESWTAFLDGIKAGGWEGREL